MDIGGIIPGALAAAALLSSNWPQPRNQWRGTRNCGGMDRLKRVCELDVTGGPEA
jgi:hypothetical protein